VAKDLQGTLGLDAGSQVVGGSSQNLDSNRADERPAGADTGINWCCTDMSSLP
jgi:hypothetical protein